MLIYLGNEADNVNQRRDGTVFHNMNNIQRNAVISTMVNQELVSTLSGEIRTTVDELGHLANVDRIRGHGKDVIWVEYILQVLCRTLLLNKVVLPWILAMVILGYREEKRVLADSLVNIGDGIVNNTSTRSAWSSCRLDTRYRC